MCIFLTSIIFFNCCTASPVPQVVRVTVKSQDSIILGYTQVTYDLTKLQQVVYSASPMRLFFEDLMSGNPSGNSGGETESFKTLGKFIFS